jgi:hypothetical protein
MLQVELPPANLHRLRMLATEGELERRDVTVSGWWLDVRSASSSPSHHPWRSTLEVQAAPVGRLLGIMGMGITSRQVDCATADQRIRSFPAYCSQLQR